MKIALDVNYTITTDSNNYILNKVSQDKKGKEVLSPFKFYPNIWSACDGFINEKVLHSKVRTLSGLVAYHNQLVDDVRKLFKVAEYNENVH